MNKITGVVLLVVLLGTPVAVYVMSGGQNAKALSRFAFALLAAVLTLIAFVGTFGYAIRGLEDFHNPSVSFATALIGNLLMWGICLGGLVLRRAVLRVGLSKSAITSETSPFHKLTRSKRVC